MATIRAKAILPKKLNDQAIMAELAGEMKAVSKEVVADFQATTRTWNNKPGFKNEFQQGARQLRFLVSTDSDIYGYVSKGTKAHKILPKRARVLAFRGGYKAKTSPGVIGSSGGGATGGEVFSRGVNHPGTKARNFDKEIASKWEKPFGTRMQKAVSRGAKKSGHAI